MQVKIHKPDSRKRGLNTKETGTEDQGNGNSDQGTDASLWSTEYLCVLPFGHQYVAALPSLLFFPYILARSIGNHGVRGIGRTCLPHLNHARISFLARSRMTTNEPQARHQ